MPKSDRLRRNLHPFFAATCFLSKSKNYTLLLFYCYALEIFCRVFHFSTIKTRICFTIGKGYTYKICFSNVIANTMDLHKFKVSGIKGNVAVN